MALQDLLKKSGITAGTQEPTKGLSALLNKTVKEKKTGKQIFSIGEGMTAEQTKKAKEVISKPVIPVGQEIKTPFMQKGVVVTSGGGVGAGYSALKTIIEFPEKATRTLTTDFGKSRQTENKQWRVPSYSEVASKEVEQLIDEGVPPTAAVILTSAQVGGEFASDALIFDFLLRPSVSGLFKSVSRDEASTIAYDFLGRPKTIAQAEANFRNIQRQFHPDISGTDKISKQANNAITILRQNGIPTQNALKTGLDKVLNRPVSEMFKPKVVGEVAPTTAPKRISGLLSENTAKPPAPRPVEPSVMPKTAPKQAINAVDEPLLIEARKYKSADEFVNKRKIVYHGTTEDASSAIEKNGFKPGSEEVFPGSFRETGGSFTTDKATAQEFANHRAQQTGGKPVVIEVDITDVKKPDVTKYGNADEIYISPSELNKIKTKSQLTDIWEKAQSVLQEIPKIKPEVVKVPSEQLPVKTEGETKVSRLEARMKEKLDLVKPEEAKAQGLSTFEQMNKKDQIAKASEYVQKNPDEALEVLKGNLPAPKELLHNSIALALETQAEITGNANLISKLASLRSTRFGQEISILTETDPLNITSQIKNIQIARETATMKKLGKKISEVQKETRQIIDKVVKEERTLAQIKVAEAERLLNEIMC
jgi:hypothetical protein